MKPFAVAALALAGGLALVVSTVSHGVDAFGPVHTVSELRAGLADNPRAWLGHTVLVRGVALGMSCPPNASCAFAMQQVVVRTSAGAGQQVVVRGSGPVLIDADATGPGSSLPLSMGPANPLLALLRRLPLLGRLVPGPQLLRWGRPAIYCVQVQDAAGTARNGTLHDEAALFDAAPPGHGPMPMWHGPAWTVLPVKPVPPTMMPLARPLPPVTMPHAIP